MIRFVKASLTDSTVVVKFDASGTNLVKIEKVIEKHGYRVLNAFKSAIFYFYGKYS